MAETSVYYVLAGGNLGNVEALINEAAERLTSIDGILIKQKSNFYRSEAWGFEHANFFLNQAWEVLSSLNAVDLLDSLLGIEHEMGRTRSNSYEARTIDLDIIFYDNKIVQVEGLVIPHALVHKRRFALLPLNELIPFYVHPILRKSVATLLNECEDKSEVSLWNRSTVI